MRKLIGAMGVLGTTAASLGGAIQQWPASGATLSAWPTQWNVIGVWPSLEEKAETGLDARYDFVGGAAWASSANYLFFQMRVAYSGTVNAPTPENQRTFSGTIGVFVDKAGYVHPNTVANRPDYAFVWDSQQNHGMEMQIPQDKGALWKNIRMQDMDGSPGSKIAPPDFNTTGDAYVRTIDHQSFNGADTTLIQMAVSWNYLQGQGILTPEDTFRPQFGSIQNANDHSYYSNGDIGLGYSVDSPIDTAWASPVPEPVSLGVGAAGSLFTLLRPSRKRRK